ncbi:hypothetical protein MMC20_003848 [Loxospora ochrophaea]|nr:hypothetical protein [Loxospora ochrophaea]
MAAMSGADVNLSETQGPHVVAVSIAMIVLPGIAVALRFGSRKLAKIPILADDWLILAALPFTWAVCASNIYGVKIPALGRHELDVTPEAFVKFLKNLMANELCITTAVFFIKLSIIRFYWRIFHIQELKIPFTVLVVVVTAWWLALCLATIFSCHPVQEFWSLSPHRHCINIPRFFLGASIPNIITDFILLIIPMPLLVRLKINRSQKIVVVGIFLLGGFVVVVSSLRLVRVLQIQESLDYTWSFSSIAEWSAVETGVGTICACLPSLRPLLTLVVNGTLKTTSALGITNPSRLDNSGKQWPRSVNTSDDATGFARLNDPENIQKWGNSVHVYVNEANEAGLVNSVPLQEVRVFKEVTVER